MVYEFQRVYQKLIAQARANFGYLILCNTYRKKSFLKSNLLEFVSDQQRNKGVPVPMLCFFTV